MDAGATSADTRTILIHDDVIPPPERERAIVVHDAVATQEILAIDERMATTTQRLEADFKKVDTKIHRFARGLRGIGGDDGRYMAPSVVAIGPCHHGSPHLQKMEEVKLAAAYYLCRSSGHSTMDVYQKVLSVVGQARGCYDADFAAMMFLDGCFLLQYMVAGDTAPVLQNRMTLSTGPSIQKDTFLLENQIPWLVLEALTEFMSVDVVYRFVAGMEEFFPGKAEPTNGRRRRRMQCGCMPAAKTGTDDERDGGCGGGSEEYTPPHLLGLLRFTQVGRMPERVLKYKRFTVSTNLD